MQQALLDERDVGVSKMKLDGWATQMKILEVIEKR